VQGQLTQQDIRFRIETSCAHCGQPITLDFDRRLAGRIAEPGCQPVVFAPLLDVHAIEDPSIIDKF
jgi:hypothetical protein